MKTPATAALLLVVPLVALAQEPVFDLHVHLREGAASVDAYEAQVASAKRHVTGFGAMWFGGPRQARAGDVAGTRAQNDALLALASKYPKLVPIATVHPYDGQAALDEVERVAGLGTRVLKLHPHTQQFEITDPRVLALVQRAGALGVVVLMDNAGIVAGDSEHLFNLAVRAPRTTFVFAHLGGMHFRFWNMLVLARTAKGFGLENVYFDLSGTVVLVADSPLEAEFVWTLRNVGVDRVLLGSDYPQVLARPGARRARPPRPGRRRKGPDPPRERPPPARPVSCRIRPMQLGRAAMSRLKALAGLSDVTGHVDRVEGPNTIVGWAIDRSAPGRRLVVECVRGGRVLGAAVADEPREDLRLAGLGDGRCGFRLTPAADVLAALDEPRVRIRVQGTHRHLGGEMRLEPDVFLWLVAADVVDNCNLRCPFCLYDYSGVTRTHLMSEETFGRLASLARGVAAGQFYISCLHEPTLHPRLNDLLALIPEDVRHKVFFTTNLARPLKDADLEAWARSGLHHINVSLDTLDPARFAELRRFGRFEVFTANLDRLAATFRRVPGAPPLRYITMAFRSNLEEIPDVVRTSRDRWLSTGNEIRYTFNVAHITDAFRRREYLFPADWEALTRRLQDTGVPFVIAPPPADGYEETITPSQNFFEDRGGGPDDQARLTLTRPLGLRVAPDGTVVVVDAERALRVNLNDLDDPLAYFRALDRRARPRADGVPLRA